MPEKGVFPNIYKLENRVTRLLKDMGQKQKDMDKILAGQARSMKLLTDRVKDLEARLAKVAADKGRVLAGLEKKSRIMDKNHKALDQKSKSLDQKSKTLEKKVVRSIDGDLKRKMTAVGHSLTLMEKKMPSMDERDVKRRLSLMEKKERARDLKIRNLENQVQRLMRAKLDLRLKTAEKTGRNLEKRTGFQDKQLSALSKEDLRQDKKFEAMEKSRAKSDKRFNWTMNANINALKKRIKALVKR